MFSLQFCHSPGATLFLLLLHILRVKTSDPKFSLSNITAKVSSFHRELHLCCGQSRLWFFAVVLFCFFTMPHSLQDVSSLTKD